MMTVAVVIAGCLGHWGVPQKMKFIFVTPERMDKGTDGQTDLPVEIVML